MQDPEGDRPTDSPSVPPHNLEAERCVLGACLLDPDAFDRAGLEDDQFYRDAHRLCWRALARLRAKGSPADLVTLKDELGAADLERAGGPAYIAGLVDGLPHSSAVEHYAGIVRRDARLRLRQRVAGWLTVHVGPVPADALDAIIGADGAAADPLAGIVTLDTIGRTEPAEPLARGLLWRGKFGVLHGGAGSGKTTLAAGVVSTLTAGASWMGRETVDGGAAVLVLSGEDVDTLMARVDQWGGDPRRVHVWSEPNLEALPAAIEATGAAAVVVDSLQSTARALGANLNDDGDAGKLVRRLAKVARDTDVAVLALHHEPWAQGRDRGAGDGDTIGRVKGSGEIAAAADYTLRCSMDELRGETTIEPTKRRHGINAERLVFIMDPRDGYTPAPDDGPRGGGDDDGMPDAIRTYLGGEGGPRTVRAIRNALGLSDSTSNRRRVERALTAMKARGEVAPGPVEFNGRSYHGWQLPDRAAACGSVRQPHAARPEKGTCGSVDPPGYVPGGSAPHAPDPAPHVEAPHAPPHVEPPAGAVLDPDNLPFGLTARPDPDDGDVDAVLTAAAEYLGEDVGELLAQPEHVKRGAFEVVSQVRRRVFVAALASLNGES